LIAANYFDADCSLKTGSPDTIHFCMFLNIMIKEL